MGGPGKGGGGGGHRKWVGTGEECTHVSNMNHCGINYN